MRVRSLPLLSGFTIRGCRELWCSLQTWLGSRVAVAVARLAATAPIGPTIGSTIKSRQSSYHGSAEMNPTRNHEVAGLIPGLALWVKDPTFP